MWICSVPHANSLWKYDLPHGVWWRSNQALFLIWMRWARGMNNATSGQLDWGIWGLLVASRIAAVYRSIISFLPVRLQARKMETTRSIFWAEIWTSAKPSVAEKACTSCVSISASVGNCWSSLSLPSEDPSKSSASIFVGGYATRCSKMTPLRPWARRSPL